MAPTVPRPFRDSRLVAAGALLTAGALLLSGCSSSTPAASTSSASTPTAGGTLTFGIGTDTSIIDPSITGSSITALIDRNVVDSLVGQAEDNSFTPWLASKWTINKANTLYTFTLRSGVTFSDGTKLDAAAVKANFDRIIDPKTSSSYAKSLLGPVSKVTAVDATTLTVAYDTPFALLLQGLSLPYLGIQSPTYLKNTKDTTNTVVGSGPYTLTSFTPGTGTVLTKRKDYDWGPGYAKHKGAAYLDTIDFEVLPDASARLGALTSGQVQAIDSVPPANAKTLAATPDLKVVTRANPGVNESFFLNTSTGPFTDEKVRRAFQSAVDVKGAVAASYFGTLQPAAGILGPSTQYFDKQSSSAWGFDAAAATKLLGEAGWTKKNSDGYLTKDGKTLTARYVYDTTETPATDVTLAQAVQSQVKKVGFDFELVPTDSGGATEATNANKYDIQSFFYVRAEPDILRTVFDSAYAPPNGADVAHVSSLDESLSEAIGATPERRAELYTEIQQEILTKAYAVPLYVAAYQLGQSTKLHGISWATNAKPLLYDAYLTK
jgi:peptide/nickel transport system substrate-binding protein